MCPDTPTQVQRHHEKCLVQTRKFLEGIGQNLDDWWETEEPHSGEMHREVVDEGLVTVTYGTIDFYGATLKIDRHYLGGLDESGVRTASMILEVLDWHTDEKKAKEPAKGLMA